MNWSGRGRAVRRRPRRSWRHCRCTNSAAVPPAKCRISKATRCSTLRIAWLAATPPAQTSAVGAPICSRKIRKSVAQPVHLPLRRPLAETTHTDRRHRRSLQRRDLRRLQTQCGLQSRQREIGIAAVRSSGAATQSARDRPASPLSRPVARPDSRGQEALRSCRRLRRWRRRPGCRCADSRRHRVRRGIW